MRTVLMDSISAVLRLNGSKWLRRAGGGAGPRMRSSGSCLRVCRRRGRYHRPRGGTVYRASLLINWRRSFRPERSVPEGQRTGFVPAMVVAETASAVPTAPARGRMVIIVGRDRRVIVDAGVDAPLWPGCSRFWSGDDPGPVGRAGVAGGRAHRHAARHERAWRCRCRRRFGRDPHAGDLFVFRGAAAT